MSKWAWLLAAGLVLAVGVASVARSEGDGAKPATILSYLKVGQSCTLKDSVGGYEIGTFTQPIAGPYKIVMVGADHVAMQDLAGLQEIRIPVYSIKSITHVTR
jgi:hypothetical protein